MQNIECGHAICLPKIHALCFLPSFMEILPFWWLYELWWKIVEFILIFYGQNMNKKHGAKKIVMSTEWMKFFFLRCLSCILRENIFSSCVHKHLQEHISCFHNRYQMFSPIIVLSQSLTIGENIQCLLWKEEIGSHKCLCTNRSFSSWKHWRCSPWGHRKNIG